MTSVGADLLEARLLLWALDTVEDPEKLAAYVAYADRILLAENGDSPEDIEAQRKRLKRLESKLDRYVDTYAEGLITKERLTEQVAPIEAEVATLRDAIERAEEVDDKRETLQVTIAELMDMPIVDTGERDWAKDEPISGAQLRDELLQAAHRSLGPADGYGRRPHLPKWARDEVARYAAAFGVMVTISKPTGPDADPRLPDLQIEFSPTAPLHLAQVSSKKLET